jgi:tetratricopeptide (TPR) repeat protein
LKWFLRRRLKRSKDRLLTRAARNCACVFAVTYLCVFAVRAELPSWAQETIAFTPLYGALYRVMGLPDGTVTHLRPAWESQARLSQLIAQAPHAAELYSLRARAEERLANFTAAETDWKQAATESQDRLTALSELADFYRRRVETRKEVSTLLRLAAVPEQPDEHFQVSAQQPQWMAFSRAVTVSNEALFPAPRYQEIYDAWIRRYPRDASPYQAYLNWAIERRNRTLAGNVAARLKAAFPEDVHLAVSTDANLARIESGNDAALAVYSKAFSPLWPETLRTEYFKELSGAHQLRRFLGEAQTAADKDAASLDPAVRLFFYYEQEGHKDVADQKLLTMMSARASRNVAWTAEELKTVSALLLRVADYDEAARTYYTLYQLPGAAQADQELGLSALISMLLDVPEQPLDFGNRDLSLYRNIAKMDRRPGFLNGILTVALNDTSPDFQYQNASQTAVAYFHRASASLLIDKLKQQFPRASQTAGLESKLFDAYATYGQEDAIIRAVPEWLNRNANSPDYVHTALLLADAYVSGRNTKAEMAIYDRLLSELANRSGHVPIGQAGVISETAASSAPSAGRSPDYSLVLDRYISRLVQLNREMDAVGLFRREIDHNADDAGIYERFALFLEQNRLDSDLEQTYKDALTHFKDVSWASKLGRYYLRHEEYDAYQALAHQITDTFRGSELAAFLRAGGVSSQALSLQVNRYAHQRFPYNLLFVRNLLEAYRAKDTKDDPAYAKLLREYWFYDAGLKSSYFEYLSSRGELVRELAKLQDVNKAVKDSNLAALELLANGEAWLTRYETAAPVYVRLASLTPGDVESNSRAISVERSLASTRQGAFDSAIRLAQQDVNAEPGNSEAITRVGEIYADREKFGQARSWWDRVDAVRPGASGSYLDSATVFWDYFQFKDALRVIGEARRKMGKPNLFGYEAGAIYENQGNYRQAVDSYLSAALQEGSGEARRRLLTLAGRKATGTLVEQQTARLTGGGFDSASFQLRLALLEKQSRRSEIQAMLTDLLPRADRTGQIEEISAVANRLGFDEIAADCMKRTIAMSNDPIEKLAARIQLARFYEAHNNTGAAQSEFAALLSDEPNRLGVVRAAVDFYWRQKQSQAAVTTLEAAAQRAQAPYHDQLEREAAEKAANSGQFEEARRLLDQLLAKDAYNGDLLAEKAATYARANDNQGLVDFYANELKALRASPLSGQDKIARVAALRRGYVLALISTEQFREALEQYQLVLNAFPEDATLASEVASFADAHQLAPLLVAYYQKATGDAPRDYRWPMVLAHIQTSLRHYPEAIAAYEKAAYVRPDRPDLLIAKADLETRLLKFDNAIKSYGKIYELSFHDVQYLADEAELYARLNNKAEAVRLLRAAYIDPHPNEPSGYIDAMQKLSDWRMFSEEAALFQQLRPMLTADSPWKQGAVTLQVQALLALHLPAEALETAGAFSPKTTVATPFSGTIGAAAALYLDPTQRAALVQKMTTSNALPGMDLYTLAQAAGLRDLEAAELERRSQGNQYLWQQLNELQSKRLLFEPLGTELEAIARARSGTLEQGQILSAAFAAYQKAGDNASQLRLAEHAGAEFARLFVMAGGDVNDRLATLARSNAVRANEVLQYMIANSAPNVANSAIAARGQTLTPLWANSYTALNALYSLSNEAWGVRSFDAILGPRSVGGALSTSGQSSNGALRNADWFYYAARYGVYLGYRKAVDAQDFMPASLEANPAASDSYVSLADSLTELKQPTRAAQLYREALQLSPERADVYDRLALLALAGNQRAEAIAGWRRAFQILAARVEKGALPPTYWPTARRVLAHVNRANAMGELKSEADSMLRSYAKRNGTYEFKPFLAGIFDHPSNRQAALQWVIELAHIQGMEGILTDVLQSSDWIDAADKDSLFRAQIDHAQRAANTAAGQAAVEARNEMNRQISSYVGYLAEQKRWPDAWASLQQIQPASDAPMELLLEAGAMSGHLNELISGFRSRSETAPQGEQVLAAAAALQKGGNSELAVQLEEYEYGRELAGSAPPALAWFGMARVRFQQKRNAEALGLIRNVTLSVGAPFENLSEGIRVLEEAGLNEDAVRYAAEWKIAEPWNNMAQLTFARLKADAKLLNAVRSDTTAPYKVRVEAARLMRKISSPVNGADELSLLTHNAISAAEASQPFYVDARLDAALQTSDLARQTKLYQEAIALDPGLEEPRLRLARSALAVGTTALGLAAFASFNRSQADFHEFAEVEQLAAQAHEQRQEWGLALQLYRDLVVHENNQAKRAALTKARDSVAEKQHLANVNLARAPAVTDHVGQPRIVKPKLASLRAESEEDQQ